MDQEILKAFFYDVRCAVVMHFSAWSAVYQDGGEPPLKPSPPTYYIQFGTNSIIVLMFVESQRMHI
jgi:UDP-glucose 4-epimerase